MTKLEKETSMDKSKAVAYAERVGAEHGKNAVGWWDQYQHLGGGRDTRPRADVLREAERLLEGIDEGDPEVLDSLPGPDLSGQDADSLSGPDLVRDAALEVVDWEDDEEGHDAFVAEHFDEVCDAYETAFMRAVEAEVTRLARAALAE